MQCVEHMVEFKMSNKDIYGGNGEIDHCKINARDFFIPTQVKFFSYLIMGCELNKSFKKSYRKYFHGVYVYAYCLRLGKMEMKVYVASSTSLGLKYIWVMWT